MKVALFVPCYIDQFYPGVAVATLALLESLGVIVDYPLNQTCCGQPMANAGFEHLTFKCNDNFINSFEGYDYVVSPSGSCVLHIKHHLHSHNAEQKAEHLRNTTMELSEFLVDIMQVKSLQARFPFKVGMHHGCHGHRGLHLGQGSEKVAPPFSKTEALLNMVEGISLVQLRRKDECCGFGGTFSVTEEAVSVKMGKDRIDDFISHGAEYITSADMSCLMHMEGLLRREKSAVKVIHLAEILIAR